MSLYLKGTINRIKSERMNEIPNVNGNPRKLFLPSSQKNKKISKLK